MWKNHLVSMNILSDSLENVLPWITIGIVTFVICFTLPFVLITGLLLVMKVFVLLASNIVCCSFIHDSMRFLITKARLHFISQDILLVLYRTLVWWRLWNFIGRHMKFYTFLHPNEHAQRIFRYFEKWFDAEPSKIGHISF